MDAASVVEAPTTTGAGGVNRYVMASRVNDDFWTFTASARKLRVSRGEANSGASAATGVNAVGFNNPATVSRLEREYFETLASALTRYIRLRLDRVSWLLVRENSVAISAAETPSAGWIAFTWSLNTTSPI